MPRSRALADDLRRYLQARADQRAAGYSSLSHRQVRAPEPYGGCARHPGSAGHNRGVCGHTDAGPQPRAHSVTSRSASYRAEAMNDLNSFLLSDRRLRASHLRRMNCWAARSTSSSASMAATTQIAWNC